MADLREIAVPAFPDAIAERKGHSTLQGKFAVQVRPFQLNVAFHIATSYQFFK